MWQLKVRFRPIPQQTPSLDSTLLVSATALPNELHLHVVHLRPANAALLKYLSHAALHTPLPLLHPCSPHPLRPHDLHWVVPLPSHSPHRMSLASNRQLLAALHSPHPRRHHSYPEGLTRLIGWFLRVLLWHCGHDPTARHEVGFLRQWVFGLKEEASPVVLVPLRSQGSGATAATGIFGGFAPEEVGVLGWVEWFAGESGADWQRGDTLLGLFGGVWNHRRCQQMRQQQAARQSNGGEHGPTDQLYPWYSVGNEPFVERYNQH